MNLYRATVRIEGMQERDPEAVRSALQAKLLQAGVEDCHIVSVEQVNRSRRHSVPPSPPRRIAPAPAEGAWRQQSNAGGVILIIAMAWAAWVIWSFFAGFLAAE